MPSRRAITWAKFRVFAVGVCALSILSVLFYLLTGGTLFQAKTTLYLYIPDATGLEPSSPVRVDGVTVGKVRNVGLSGSNDPNRVVRVAMTIEVEHLNSIPTDSSAQISTDNVIGDKFVDVTSGRARVPVPPNGEIRYQPEVDVMKNLDLAQFERSLRNVDAMLRDIEEGKGPVGQLVRGEDLYNDTRKRLIGLERGLRAAARTTGQVGEMLYADTLYRKISVPVRQLDDTLARIQSGQGPAGLLLRDSGQYDSLRAQAASLREMLAGMAAGRGPTGDLLSSDATYRNLGQTIGSMIAFVDNFNASPLLTSSEMYDNLNGSFREMCDFLRDFRESPKKYLWLKLF
jgi:phospholipid/cholesterol/gamma-HCH transport system substrate-binding protein